MHDFYAPSRPAPLDQADGLRRMFAGRRLSVLALAANPYVPFSGVVLDRLAATLSARGCKVLVVDASAASPAPHELATVELAVCVEQLSPRVAYLAARGLPMKYVDTRGNAASFLQALTRAAPQADVVLLHAEAQDLVRVFKRRCARPVLLGADHPDSIKHAYACAKLLSSRCSLLTFDLLLAMSPQSPRVTAIGQSLAGCADTFLGAVVLNTAVIDPAVDVAAPPDTALASLLAAQLAMDEDERVPSALRASPVIPARTAFR